MCIPFCMDSCCEYARGHPLHPLLIAIVAAQMMVDMAGARPAGVELDDLSDISDSSDMSHVEVLP